MLSHLKESNSIRFSCLARSSEDRESELISKHHFQTSDNPGNTVMTDLDKSLIGSVSFT